MSKTPVAHPTVWPWQSLVRVRHPSMLYDTDIATRETSLRVAMRSLVVVVFFWWSATGIIFALERSEATRALHSAVKAGPPASQGGTAFAVR